MKKIRKTEETFGGRLKALRLAHPEGPSIREVARRAGIDVSYLSRMEKEEVAPPSEEVILRLCEVLGVEDSDELLKLADKIHPDLQEIIRDQVETLPAFLRIAKDFSQEDWDRLTRYVKRSIRPSREAKK
jgi:transcriptional regulator with XRE-family HTH domain